MMRTTTVSQNSYESLSGVSRKWKTLSLYGAFLGTIAKSAQILQLMSKQWQRDPMLGLSICALILVHPY